MPPQPAQPPHLSPANAQALQQAQALGRAGRLAEAERLYRAVLQAEPGCVQAAAALARLLTAAGRAAEAEALVRPFVQGKAIWPEALSARAAALKALDRKPESLADYMLAAQLNPASGVAAHNVASGLGDAGRDREAVAEAERAFALGLQAPETWLVYGRALQGLRRFAEAEDALRQAIARRPAYVEALRDLCQLIWMQSGDAQAALAPIDAALAAVQPASAAALAGVKIRLLHHLSGEAPALAFAQEALAKSPGDPRLALETAALSLRGAPERSRELCAAVLARNPRDPTARRAMAHAHLALGEAAAAAEVAEGLLADNPIDQEAAAALATARRLAGDERYRDLWDYDALVRAQTIDTPAGWASLEAYLGDLRGALAELHALQAHPIEQSVRGGAQTSQNLLAAEHPAIRAFFEAVQGPIRAYRAAVGPGADLFRARNRGGHRVLGAWSVRLKPGGFHVDHIHPQGWISSACYIDVPQALGAGEDRAGWLRFGAPPIPTRPTLEAEHFVRPQPGLLALFPSYIWHGTVPFGGDQVRTTIAFDVVPD
ncbi:putative 2OG-Fe(II) oxygenase [Phenylobacterium sp.]|uniref:putative 2OG-Fe(II) oxygenase n=1 Tax=Phenylobacterium sp. TaxID=1871053 RepID=UPI0028A001B9|nr:putative 2OG-Fe(II) oxygenase [Phenylobacterium sp.]